MNLYTGKLWTPAHLSETLLLITEVYILFWLVFDRVFIRLHRTCGVWVCVRKDSHDFVSATEGGRRSYGAY